MRKTISFADFQINFMGIVNGYGWLPLDYTLQEDGYTGEHQKVLNLDMVCHWRISGGKFILVSVTFENEAEFNELIDYCKKAVSVLQAKLLEDIENLKFPVDNDMVSDKM